MIAPRGTASERAREHDAVTGEERAAYLRGTRGDNTGRRA